MAEEEDVSAGPDVTTAPVPPGYAGPITTTTTGGDQSTYSTTKPAPGEVQAINAALGHREEGAQLAKDAADAQALGQQQIADLQGTQSDLAHQQAADAAADHQAMVDRIDAARGKYEESQAALAGTPFHKYWDNASTPNKILTGVGALFTGLSGNSAAQAALNQSLDSRINQDFEVQKAKRADQFELAKQRGADVNALYSQWEKEEAHSAVKRQLAHEAVAAQILEIGTRAGIPRDQLLASAAYNNQIAQAQEDKAKALSHFDAHGQTTRELTPKVSTTEGKLQGGAKGAGPGGAQAFAGDVEYLKAHPPSAKALDAASRALTDKPTIVSQGAGLLEGGRLPDYFAGLTEEEKQSAETVMRVVPRVAMANSGGTRAVNDKDRLLAAVHSSIPVAGDEKANARKFKNLSMISGAAPTPVAMGASAGPRPASKPATVTTPDKVVHHLQADGTYD